MDERLTARNILIESRVLVQRSWLFGLAWLTALVACGTAIDAMDLDQRTNIFFSLLSVFGQFAITSAALRAGGLHHAWAKPGRAASFVGAGLLTGIAIVAGFFALVLPAVFLYARWLIVQPLIIGEGRTMGEAMAESWRRTAPSTLVIMIAVAAALAPMVGGFLLLVFAAPLSGPIPLGLALVSNLLICGSLIMTWYLAVAVHCLFEAHRSTAEAPDPDIGPVGNAA